MGLRIPFKREIDPNEVRYCKKCGTELAGDNKSNLCANCREERARKIKAVIISVVSIGGTIGTVVAELQKHRHKSDEDGDDKGQV